MAEDDTPPPEALDLPESTVEAELARALAVAQREIYWLRRERARLLTELHGAPPEEDGEPARDGDGATGEDTMLRSVAEEAVPVAARRLALRESASTDTWDRLTDGVRDLYLTRAAAAVEAVAPIFAAALAAVPGQADLRRAQHRLGLRPDSGLAELLDHVRAEGRARAMQEVAGDVRDRLQEYEATRRSVQAVELVVVEGEHMAAEHPSAVAVEVAEWFARRLQQALAAPDVTLGDALEAEREQALLAVAAELGMEGMDAVAWYSRMSNRLDAAAQAPDAQAPDAQAPDA